MLKAIKDAIKTFKEVLQLFIALWRLVKKNPRPFLVLIIIIGIYYGLQFYAYTYPAITIKRYFDNIDNGTNYEIAWGLIDSNYRASRWKNLKDFAAGYKTTSFHKNRRIKYLGSTVNPIWGLFADDLTYELTCDVEDTFTEKDLSDNNKIEDIIWIIIKDFYDLKTNRSDFINGTIILNDYFKFRGAKTIRLVRSFKKIITIRKINSTWKIISIKTLEAAIKIN